MAIKARCGNCNTGFTAKDALAGRRVNCPKCKNQLTIPEKKPASQALAPAQKAAHNPLLDLLDEAGVEAVPRGPVCDNCGSGISRDAIICVQCGFNMATGQRLETAVFEDDDDSTDEAAGMTDTEKIMARAEQEIDDMPVSSYGQDFGDGSESILIAGVSFGILGVLIAIGVGIIFVMDQIGDSINSSVISFWASMVMALGCGVWITLVAFLTRTSQGVICVCTAGLYCIVFGFMQGRALLVPTIILCASLFIGLLSSFFAFQDDGGFGMLLNQLVG